MTAHDALVDRLAFHELLLEHTEDAIVAVDPDWLITGWNVGAERMYGWTAAEVLGRHVPSFVRMDLSDEERARLRRDIAERGRWRGEVTVERRDGSPVAVEVINVAVRDAGGEITGYLGIHRDVTERKLAEEALRVAHRRSERILETISDSFFALDREWRYTYLNAGALDRIRRARGAEFAREDVLGRNCWEFIPGTVGTVFDRELHRAVREQTTVDFEAYSAPTATWTEVRAYPSEEGLAVYARDVSGRKRADEALHHAQRRAEALLDGMSDEFFAIDGEWRYTYLNERTLAQCRKAAARELAADELLGANIWEMWPQQVGTPMERELRRAMDERTVVEFEAYGVATARWLELRAHPTEDGLAVFARDISDRKAAQEQMRARAEQQALVAQLGRRALAGDDLQSLLDEGVALVAATLDVELVAVAEILADGGELLLRAGVGWREGAVGRERGAAGRRSLVGYTLLNDEPVVSDDVAGDDRFTLSPLLAAHAPVSAMSVVIAGRDEPFGALGAFATRRRSFSADDVNFLQAVANVLATAVARATVEERLAEVRETERQRIARVLNDQALQELGFALARATAAAASDEDAADRLRELGPALARVREHLRGAIYDLRLGRDERRPFRQLLTALIDVHQAAAPDCEIELQEPGAVPARPLGAPGTEMVRIVGEALTNARQHSGARHVRVRAWSTTDLLCARVADDGRGLSAGGPAATGHGAGIAAMRERADLLGGRLDITSAPDTGTVVHVEVPLATAGEAPAAATRVLLVDDHAAVRQAIATAFGQEPGVEITGQAASLAEARAMLPAVDVDVALLDLRLPDGHGCDLIPELRHFNPRAQALVLSATPDRREIAGAIERGAAGVLGKTAHLDVVVDTIRRLGAGETVMPLDEMLDLLRYASRQREREHDDRQALAELTARERQVLQGLADGLNVQQIAERLHISARTARNHTSNILTKLRVHSQLQALLLGLRYDVVQIPRGADSWPD